ncbi:MAG TPA: hypothetical protein VFF12_13460, partial [Myxococcaceae bacterium]|nr:hypothetical protein [Myxococcaceae bacterium]
LWMFKQGAEAWNDAFGPDEVPEAAASPVAGGTGSTQAAPPTKQESSVSSPAPPGAVIPPAAARAPSTPRPGKTAPPAQEPPPPGPHEATSAPPSAPPTASTAAPDEEKDEEDAEENDSSDEDERVEAALEEKIKALQAAPPEERSKRTAELVASAVEKAKKEATRAQKRAERQKGTEKDPATELAEDRQEVTVKLGDLAIAAEALAREPPSATGDARKARHRLEKRLNELEKDQQKLERRGAPPLTEDERAKLARARAALLVAQKNERGFWGRLGAVWALLVAFYASLAAAQTVVLALSRDFHDVLSRDLSLHVHVAPEDPPMRPRIRLDVPWVRRKASRRAWTFLGFLPGTVLITIVGRLVPPHRTLTTVLTALWAAYWWMVLTAGQSARAWTPPETTPRPWYLRAWFALTDRVFFFGWGPFKWWGRIWERFARRFYGPSERVQEQPYEFAGLGFSRALLLVPVLKLLFRPIFSVAAARLLVEHAATARLPIPVTAIEVADAAAHAPDPEARTHSGVAT